MERLYVTLIGLLIFIVLPIGSRAASWPEAALKVRNSVTQVEILDNGHHSGACTAFSINFPKRLYITAEHCVKSGDSLQLDGVSARVVYENTDLDLAVIEGRQARKAIPLAKVSPRVGESVGAIGYVYDFPVPILIQGNVAADWEVVKIPGFPLQPYFILGEGFVGGMSGGPMFNWDGEVVSVVQMGDPADHLGIGRPLKIIREVIGKYWE